MMCQNCKREYEGNYCPFCGIPSTTMNNLQKGNLFCTNCGKPNKHNICLKCGVKNNTTHNYCYYCGNIITNKASICINCHEPIRGNILVRVLAIISLCIFPIWLLIVAMGTENFLCTLFVLLSALPMLFVTFPIGQNLIRRISHKKRWTRFWLFLLCFILSFTLAVTPLFMDISNDNSIQSTQNNTDKSLDDTAIVAAKVVLQSKLKNPQSLTINNSEVQITGNDDGNIKYTVTLDYSAQNSFGGFNRDTYTVSLTYNVTEGDFYWGNTKIITK